MTTTDHQQAAEQLRGELRGRQQARAATFADLYRAVDDHDAILGALIGIVASIPAPQVPQESPEPAPEGDGTTDPASGPETGAQRFEVEDRVQVRELLGAGTVLEAGADGYCEIRHDDDGRVSTTHVSWLEPLPPVEPTPNAQQVIDNFVGAEARRLDDRAKRTPDAEMAHDLRVTVQARTDLRTRLEQAQPSEPTPDPVVLPTTPGSVAWTLRGDICALTDLSDWYVVAGPHIGDTWTTATLLGLGIARTFDAGTGQVRVFDAGTVA